MEDDGRDWLLELLHEVQLDQFFVRIRDELQVCTSAVVYLVWVIPIFVSAKLLPSKPTRDCRVTRSASASRVREVMGSILGPNRRIATDVKSCTYCCYGRCSTLIE